MKSMAWVIGIFIGGVLFAGISVAQDLIIYPNKGQSQEQMNKDKAACQSWAQDQSGYNPAAPQTAGSSSPQENAPQGGLVKGAARGALVGVTVGAIAGDAGKGAAIGAAGGGLLGGMRQRDHRKQEHTAAQQDAAAMQQKKETYHRAYEACLEAKGYTVK